MVVTLIPLKLYHSIDALFKLYRMQIFRHVVGKNFRVGRNRSVTSPQSVIERAGSRIRTDDLLITNQLLYQLSYAGVFWGISFGVTLLFASTIESSNQARSSRRSRLQPRRRG